MAGSVVAGAERWGASPALIGISAVNRIVRWAPGKVLGYAVSRVSFPGLQEYELARDSMLAATKAWEGACGIDFEYLPQHDDHPNPAATAQDIDPAFLFTVRYVDAGGQFIAAAFSPTYPPARRRVLIDPSYYADDLGFDRVGVLRHELGHVLGFRHKHITSGAPAVCPDEDTSDVVDLTPTTRSRSCTTSAAPLARVSCASLSSTGRGRRSSMDRR